MVISKHKVVFGFVIFLAPVSMFSRSVDVIVEGHEFSQEVAPEVRHLVGNEIDTLNAVLAMFPATTVRINVAKRKAKDVQKMVKDRLTVLKRDLKEDGAFIKEQIEALVAPMREFLDFIKQHKNTARGLIDQCLEGQVYRKGLATADSFLYKFLEMTASIEEVALQEVTSIDALQILSKDVEALGGSIMESLSAKAKQAFEETLSKLRKR